MQAIALNAAIRRSRLERCTGASCDQPDSDRAGSAMDCQRLIQSPYRPRDCAAQDGIGIQINGIPPYALSRQAWRHVRRGPIFERPATLAEGTRGSTLLVRVEDMVLRLHGHMASVSAIRGAGIGRERVGCGFVVE